MRILISKVSSGIKPVLNAQSYSCSRLVAAEVERMWGPHFAIVKDPETKMYSATHLSSGSNIKGQHDIANKAHDLLHETASKMHGDHERFNKHCNELFTKQVGNAPNLQILGTLKVMGWI